MRRLRMRRMALLGALLLAALGAAPALAATPLSTDDAYVTDMNTPLAVPAPGVLVNDGDDDGDPVFVLALVSAPGHGTVTLNGDGSFTYTPALDFVGLDSFYYEAHDGADVSNTAEVRITVAEPATPPEPGPELPCAVDARFLSPLADGSTRQVKSGGIVPVSVAVTCAGTHVPGLAPVLDLHVGTLDPADIDTPTNAPATSANDGAPGGMVERDEKYSYKLALPGGLSAGQVLTLRVRPYGAGTPAIFATLVVRR